MVLLVDDDAALVRFLSDRLRRDSFEVIATGTGADAIRAIDERWPDLVILDLMLPDCDGEQVAAEIKARADIPIIVLSAVTDNESKAELIARFAEDYLTKPFHFPELRARVDRVLDRLQDRIPTQELVLGPDLRLILRRRQAIVAERPVRLTPIETRLLATLAAAKGEVVTTERILHRVWPDADGADPVYVWVTMHRLRQKLEVDPQAPKYLHTHRGGGYRLGAIDPQAT
jgi:DNA-binding response OmpR family regulator